MSNKPQAIPNIPSAAAVKRNQTLAPSRFASAVHAHNTWTAMIPAGVTLNDILKDPNYFAHVASQIRVGDEIRLVAEEGTWVAWLYVAFVNGKHIVASLRQELKLDTNFESRDELRERFVVKLCGPLKYCIMDQETGQRVREGIENEVAARRQLDDYIKALSR